MSNKNISFVVCDVEEHSFAKIIKYVLLDNDNKLENQWFILHYISEKSNKCVTYSPYNVLYSNDDYSKTDKWVFDELELAKEYLIKEYNKHLDAIEFTKKFNEETDRMNNPHKRC